VEEETRARGRTILKLRELLPAPYSCIQLQGKR